MNFQDYFSTTTRSVIGVFAFILLVLFFLPESLVGDPPDEDGEVPVAMPESYLESEGLAKTYDDQATAQIRLALAMGDRFPDPFRQDVLWLLLPIEGGSHSPNYLHVREEVQYIVKAHGTGNMSDEEYQRRLIGAELDNLFSGVDSIRERLIVEGAILSAAYADVDLHISRWWPDRSEQEVATEKQTLASLSRVLEQLVTVRERVELQRRDIRIQIERKIRIVQRTDAEAAQQYQRRLGDALRESYIDGSEQNHLLGTLNWGLKECEVQREVNQEHPPDLNAFTAINVLHRARVRQEILESGRPPIHRLTVSLSTAHGTPHSGHVVQPGQTMQLIYEVEGCMLQSHSDLAMVLHEGRPVRGLSLHWLYVDPIRVEDEQLTRLMGSRNNVLTDFFYITNRILFIEVGQSESREAQAAHRLGWTTIEVSPGDVIKINPGGVTPITLGVEEAQPELVLIDAESDVTVPLTEMRYGVSYFLELKITQRHRSSTLYYELTWGEGRFQNKDILMTRVVSNVQATADFDLRNGYLLFRSASPIVFDDASLPVTPRRAR